MGTPLVTRGVQRRDGAQSPRAHQREIGRRRMKGVAAVEFALVVPFLLVVLFGIIDFGFMLYDKAVLTNAAREGARAGIVLGETRLTKGEIENVAHQYCQGNMIRLGSGDGNDCVATATVPGNIQSLDS
ncbi:MAG TPA: TadE/TadG family type IV pilus assembly protein, partial [Geminicoccaceae bacterium]|nr:TadE/TadG family type IV pilus assembly protein [Geminicoccaceae bacterium]